VPEGPTEVRTGIPADIMMESFEYEGEDMGELLRTGCSIGKSEQCIEGSSRIRKKSNERREESGDLNELLMN